MTYTKLFSPISIRDMNLKNRIMMPAMGTKFANINGTVSQQLIDFHVARVQGGCGLNMVEVACVNQSSAPKGFLGIYSDRFHSGLSQLTSAIHHAGGKVGLQLWQGGLAASYDPGCRIFLPSERNVSEAVVLPAMSIADIDEIKQDYAAAARRAVQAGFDCIEVHAAHNYLLHTFLSPAFNHRTDKYGGDFENRCRFPLSVLRAIRKEMPDGMPLFLRIGAHDDYLENGLTIHDVIRFCRRAKKIGVDVLDITRGNIVTPAIQYEVPPIDVPRGFNIPNAAKIRKATQMTTIGVGRINTPEHAESILVNDLVDMVALGRAQLADADFCHKAKHGHSEDIRRCIGCNQGCYDGFTNRDRAHITCLRNPAVGRESEYQIKKTSHPKKVLIAGGGPAGLEAALTLKLRGHIPILCEQSDKLGGQFLLAGQAPKKEEIRDAAINMATQVRKNSITVRLNTPVTPELIRELSPDIVFCTIGAVPDSLQIPGADLPFVCDAHDILDQRIAPINGHVVVIGGGLVGIECAEHLSLQGCQITILEKLPEIGSDLGDIRKISVQERLAKADISVRVNITCQRIEAGNVIAEQNKQEESLVCDSVVIAVGAKSRDSSDLEKACHQQHIPFYLFGDALFPRRALEAISEAAEISRYFDTQEII